MESYQFAFSNSSEDDADVVIFGLPIREGSETDMSMSPDEIRKASYSIYSSVYGNIGKLKISDIGNINKESVKKIGKRFVMLGSNHLSTYYALHSEKASEIKNIVIFDSHPDCFGNELNHGSFVKFLHKEGFETTLVGVSNASEEEKAWLKKNKVKWFSSKDVFWDFETVRNSLPEKAYVSIDMDVFVMNSGSFQSELLGILPHHALRLMKSIEIQSGDIVESLSSGAQFSARMAVEMIGMMGNPL